jgi:hypothetical protein
VTSKGTDSTFSVSVAGLRVALPMVATGPARSREPARSSAVSAPKPAPRRGSWGACPICAEAGDGSCATCGGSGVVLIRPEQAPAPMPKAAAPAAKKAPAKKTAARKKTEPPVTPTSVEAIERGQLVRWSTADLFDPPAAADEDRFWPVPEGVWREVNSVTAETTEAGDPAVCIEYACSRYSDGDFDERQYRPGAVLPTRPAKFRTHKLGSTLAVGDHLKIGPEEWIVHADWLEQIG